MGIISYAQNFEDVLLWRALGHIEHGCYVDIGAHDPVVDSVSKVFYEHGWRGIHVEPLPVYCDALRRDRPDETVSASCRRRRNRRSSLSMKFPVPVFRPATKQSPSLTASVDSGSTKSLFPALPWPRYLSWFKAKSFTG